MAAWVWAAGCVLLQLTIRHHTTCGCALGVAHAHAVGWDGGSWGSRAASGWGRAGGAVAADRQVWEHPRLAINSP